MKDQYDETVPDDLVAITPAAELTPEQVAAIDRLAWYEPARDLHPGWRDAILVSYAALAAALGEDVSTELYTELPDIGLPTIQGADRIADALKRYDGCFYHA